MNICSVISAEIKSLHEVLPQVCQACVEVCIQMPLRGDVKAFVGHSVNTSRQFLRSTFGAMCDHYCILLAHRGAKYIFSHLQKASRS